MYPILFSLGRHPIYSYGVVMTLTLLAVFAWLAWQQKRAGDGRLDAALLALAVGLVGARLAHGLANWEYYREHWQRLFDLRDGGLSFHGGLLAGMLAITAAAAWQRRTADSYRERLKQLAGALVTPLALGLLGGWVACLLAGCAYGRAIAPPQRFYTPDWPDIYGVLAFRLPSQVLGILLALLLLLFARPLGRRPGLFLLALGVGDFLVAWTRADLPVSWGPLRATQWVDILLVIAGLVLASLGELRQASVGAGGTDGME